MNGPRPSTRVFLSDLTTLPTDTKIRFLGCVTRYTVATGHLNLEHNYPRSKTSPSAVSVDITGILEDVTAEALRIGTWLNVLGYVREIEPIQPTSSFSSNSGDAMRQSTIDPRPVYIEAIMVFAAGAIAVGEYERILRSSQDVEQMIKLNS
ncbi:unnamed protein product [Penicillium olsonii]|uniref:CST complex subunit Ten1 n=1 Tax=Penicillium olsonii TaxID=99116 RepID=A0A9W4HSF3_PENOL|nr:unnamed protein product [Penicillium olsonii]CAG7932311.1 unnamed protein product [Penicillium olsonii]CAG8134519.1 unnamed protein product [Penicillium olsonii]CAG8137102.1 unnamed protein product [Penicillium olsonii]CAG8140031.1 unnamed protein product [Penicillium olsonii]